MSTMPITKSRQLLSIRGLLCVASLVINTRSAHLSKEFVSLVKEETRSMELNHALDPLSEVHSNQEVTSVLCGKFKEWSSWSPCNRKCEETRVRRCGNPQECGRTWVKEKRTCAGKRNSCSPLTYKIIGMERKNRMIEESLYDLLYYHWSNWGPCTRSCRQRRQRQCKHKPICDRSYIQEERRCEAKNSKCEHRFSLKPIDVGVDYGKNSSLDLDDDDVDGSNDDLGYQTVISNAESSLTGNGATTTNDPSEEVFGKEDDNEKETHEDKKKQTVGKLQIDIPTRPTSSRNQRKERRRSRSRSRSTRRGRRGPDRDDGFNVMPRKCGNRPKHTSGFYRVVGGQEVRKNSWPWQVAIMTKYQEQYCGGTLIAPRWVLTAAHCVRKNGKRRKLIVRVGEHDTTNYEVTQGDIRPEKEFPHPAFDYQTITNDIALIKLRHSPSAYSRPGYACLPSEDYTPPRKRLCTIVGWGKIKSSNVHGSDALHEAQVPVVRHRKCQRVFEYPINPSQVCAGYKRGGTDSCAGDSGGPLLCKDKSNRYVIYGVTSYGEGCGLKGKYGIYSKVTSYLEWIHKTIRDNR